MTKNINVITNNSYFYIGMAAQLCADDRVINQMSFDELKQLSIDNFNQCDALIFHAPNYSDEMSFLIWVLTFPGDIVLVPAGIRTAFYLDFERRLVIDVHTDDGTQQLAESEKPVSAAHFIHYKLTRRERAILLHTIHGKTPQAIGELLTITTKTVYTHRRNALRKLGGRNLFQLCAVKDKVSTAAIFSV